MVSPERQHAGAEQDVQAAVTTHSDQALHRPGKDQPGDSCCHSPALGRSYLYNEQSYSAALGKPKAWNAVAWPQFCQVNNDIQCDTVSSCAFVFSVITRLSSQRNCCMSWEGLLGKSNRLKGNCTDSKPRPEVFFVLNKLLQTAIGQTGHSVLAISQQKPLTFPL